VNLIDVLWIIKGPSRIVSAIEVEKSTSTYSGILGLIDLSLSVAGDMRSLFLVAADEREEDIVRQLQRPSLRGNHDLTPWI